MRNELTVDEQATNFVTMRHIERVRNLLNTCVRNLLYRGERHDQSKLEQPEVSEFTRLTPILKGLTYGSPEYDKSKEELADALAHHYANNRHHPEHFKRGIQDMNLLDLVEMFCDWKAASERHNDGNIRKSIAINADRYNFPTELVSIFENTIEVLDN